MPQADLDGVNFQEFLNSITRDTLFGGFPHLDAFADVGDLACELSQSFPSSNTFTYGGGAVKKEYVRPVFAPAPLLPEGPSARTTSSAVPSANGAALTAADPWDDNVDMTACSTCYIPTLDTAPDVHGHTANFFGSIGRVGGEPAVLPPARTQIETVANIAAPAAVAGPVPAVAVDPELDFLFSLPVDTEQDVQLEALGGVLPSAPGTDAVLDTIGGQRVRTPPVPGCSDPFDDSGNWFSGEDVYQETLTATPSPSVDGSSDVLQRGVPAVVAGSRKRTAGSLPLVSTANTIFPTGDSCCYVATAAGQQDVSDAVGARAKKIARQNDVEGPHGGSPTLCSADADAEADGGCDDQELLPVVAAEPMAHPTTARAGRKTASAPRVLPDNAVTVLKAWMLSPEHVDHPYPSDAEKQRLAAEANITVKQVSVWFTNARKRLWLPLRQAEGKPGVLVRTPLLAQGLQRRIAAMGTNVAGADCASASGAGQVMGPGEGVPMASLSAPPPSMAPLPAHAPLCTVQSYLVEALGAVKAEPVLSAAVAPLLGAADVVRSNCPRQVATAGVPSSADVAASAQQLLKQVDSGRLKELQIELAARRQQLRAMIREVELQEQTVRSAIQSFPRLGVAANVPAVPQW